MVRLGERVSTSFSGKLREHRRYGFTVRDIGDNLWAVRFDDGAEEHIPSGRLRAEHNSLAPTRIHADELFEAQFLPTEPQRREQLVPFDVSKFDFRSWVVDAVLQPAAAEIGLHALDLPPGTVCPAVPGGSSSCGGAGTDETARLLSNLHRTPAAAQRALQFSRTGGRQRANRTEFHSRYSRIWASDSAETLLQRARFDSLLRSFVRGVVAPLLGVGPDDVSYQKKPTLRISYPAAQPMGHPHTDYAYHHQPCEINFWIPLTAVWGTNTLHTESSPGAGDFHPLELGWGSCIKFWGNQCEHFCVANDSDFTRVSLDFRALATSRFDPDFTDSRGNAGKFRLGQYYSSSAIPATANTAASRELALTPRPPSPPPLGQVEELDLDALWGIATTETAGADDY